VNADDRNPSGAPSTAARDPGLADDSRWQHLWLAIQRRPWRSVAVLAASAGVDTLELSSAISKLAWRYSGEPSTVFDLRTVTLRLVDYQLREIAERIGAGERAVLALTSIGENPASAPLARGADCVIVCAAPGKTPLKSVQAAIQQVGRDRVIGSLLVERAAEGSRAR